MDIKRLDIPKPITDNHTVRFKEMGNIFEIMSSEKVSQGGYIKKIDKNNYVDLSTGEMKEFKHLNNRAEDINNVAKSLAQGRDILNTNITDVTKCRWVTLTYADNMTDPEKLTFDFKNFNKRAREIFGHYEYITAAEPQGRGAWHLHCVFIFEHTAPYMDNKVIADCWKQGFVTVKRLDDIDNVGAYLTAYLGDMELNENEHVPNLNEKIKEVEFTDDTGIKKTKKYIKGARLYMYPPGFHIFRWSKGIKKPVITITSYKRAKEKVNSGKLTFSKTVCLDDVQNNYQNELTYEYYNKIRK